MNTKKMIEEIGATVGIVELRLVPFENDFYPAPHWYLETGDGGKFAGQPDEFDDLIEMVYEQVTGTAQPRFAADGGDWLCNCPSVNPSYATWCGRCGQPRHH